MNSRKVNAVISLVLAVVLWMYVVGKMDPQVSKVYRDVTVHYQNEQVLSDKGLAMSSGSITAVDITVTGKRSKMAKMTRSKVKATVDLSDTNEGSNSVDIRVKVPNSIEVTAQSDTKTKVTVEKRVTDQRRICVYYTGLTSKDIEEPSTLRLYPKTITVGGAESLVKKVAYVKAPVSADSVQDELTSNNAELTPVDEDGNTVKRVTVSQSNAAVSSQLYPLKKVRLNVSVKDNSDDEYEREIDVPGSVYVKGPKDKLADLDSIVAERVDVTDITSSETIKVVPVLPDGVELSQRYTDGISMKVSVVKRHNKKSSKKGEFTSKNFAFTGEDIELTNAGKKKIKVTTKDIDVQITGTQSQLSKISSSDIILAADCKGLAPGTASVKLKAYCGEEYNEIYVVPSYIKVSISK